MKWVKEFKCMGMDGNQTCGGDHFVLEKNENILTMRVIQK